MLANNPETVKIYDLVLERVTHEIPSSELTSAYTRFTPPDIEGPVFALLKDHRNPDRGHDLAPLMPSIRAIHNWIIALVVEDEPIEWEEFLCNFKEAGVPERELACWVYAIDRFKAVTAGKILSAVQRQEVFALLNQIAVVGINHVLNTFDLRHLTHQQAEQFLQEAITL